MKNSMRLFRKAAAASLLVAAFGAGAAEALQLVRAGGEIRITTTPGSQFQQDVAMDAAGNFVAVWVGASAPAFDFDIFAQRFDANGSPLGSEFRVNTFTGDEQSGPRVGMDAAGNFVVVWTSLRQFPSTIYSVLGQRFDSAGNPVGGEFRISTGPSGITPDVAMGADGAFLVVWDGHVEDVSLGLLYGSDGTPRTAPFALTSTPFPRFPAVTAAPDGSWVVAWTGPFDFVAGTSVILARRFDADGNPVGSETVAGVPALTPRTETSVAASSDQVVVTWTDRAVGESPAARLFDFGLTPLTGGLQVSTLPTQPAVNGDVAMDDAGRFVAAWTERDLLDDNGNLVQPTRDGSVTSVLARAFDADGAPLGGDFVVNTTTESIQALPRLAMSPSGRLVATWVGPDADGFADVFAQIFELRDLTPQEQIDALIDDITALVEAGALPPNSANPLITKLDGAVDKLDASQVGAACNQFAAFINQVNAYISNGTLTAAQGQALIDATQSIRTDLGC